MAKLRSKWVGNLLRFLQGSTPILDIDGANNCVDIAALKIAGVAVGATAAELNALDLSAMAVARTATTDGLTTGIIADAGLIQFVTVTSDDANKIIVLPTPTPGTIVVLHNGTTGYELRSSAPSTVLINAGAGGAAVESAIAANSTAIMICVTALAWKGFFMDADSDLAKVEAAAT